MTAPKTIVEVTIHDTIEAIERRIARTKEAMAKDHERLRIARIEAAPFQVGQEVEASRDNGKTWQRGIVRAVYPHGMNILGTAWTTYSVGFPRGDGAYGVGKQVLDKVREVPSE